MDRREYKGYGFSIGLSFSTPYGGAGLAFMKGISVDLDSFKIDEASVGISKSSKSVEKAIEEAIAISPSVAKKLKPFDALKKNII